MITKVEGSQASMHLQVPLTPGRRGALGDGIPDVLQSLTSSPSSVSLVQVGTLPKFLYQWRSITSNRFVLNIVKGHHLQLRCYPLLFHDFRWFNIKRALAHHPIIQKEGDVLLSKGAIEPSSGGASFYFNIFVVPWWLTTHSQHLKDLIAICIYLLLRCLL